MSVSGEARLLEVDTVVVCAGQESVRELVEPLTDAGVSVPVIGGADAAAELDAKRAIRQGTELAARLCSPRVDALRGGWDTHRRSMSASLQDGPVLSPARVTVVSLGLASATLVVSPGASMPVGAVGGGPARALPTAPDPAAADPFRLAACGCTQCPPPAR